MDLYEPIRTHALPRGEKGSEDYVVTVNGRQISVYRARVSAAPINQVWPGYQRPIEQTELASFAYWDMSGPVTVQIVSKRAVDTVVIKPLSKGIRPVVIDDTITFMLVRPCQLSVEVNGTHHALHLFANPPEDFGVDREGPGVRFFGPGVHHAGKIGMQSGDTVFIDAGAVVYGCIEAKHAKDIRILGRGILDTGGFSRFEANGCISLYRCENVRIDGIILRDPNVWTIIPAACEHVNIHNVKLVGLWRYNSDGIDVVNSRHVRITDSFIRSYDDSIVVKGLKDWAGDPTDAWNVQDVFVSGCTIWCDWGRALELGAETCADEMSDITFTDCDIIRTNWVALDLQHGDRATVRNVLYENIRFEIDDVSLRPKMQSREGELYVDDEADTYCPEFFVIEIVSTMWSRDNKNGCARDFRVRNVDIFGKRFPPSKIYGLDDEHNVKNVVFENIRFNGVPVTGVEACNMRVGPYAEGVRFE